MNYKNYYKKYGYVYGISTKFEFGRWTGYAKKFTNLDEAEKWLETCEYDFRERELCGKTKASRSGYRLEEYRDWSFEKYGKNSKIK